MIPSFNDALRCAAYWVAKVSPELDDAGVVAKARALTVEAVEASRGSGTLPDYAQAVLRIQDWGIDHLPANPLFYH